MRSYLFKITWIALAMMFFYGCISGIEKRRYRKGYHFAHKASIKSKASEMDLVKQGDRKTSIITSEKEITVSEPQLFQACNIGQLKSKKTKVAPSQKKELTAPEKTGSSDLVLSSQMEKHVSNNNLKSQKEERPSGLWYFLSLLLLPLISKFKKANDLARWASHNKTASRWAVAGCNVVGLGAGFGLGYMIPCEMQSWMAFIPFVLSVGSFWMFESNLPARQKHQRKRLAIGLFSIASLFGAFGLGCNLHPEGGNEFVTNPLLGVFLSVLLIGLYAGALLLLFSLACNIACAGYEVLAIVFMVGSGYGVTYLLALSLAHLFKRRNDDKKKLARLALIISIIILAFILAAILVALAF